jgi:hypothetical protein
MQSIYKWVCNNDIVDLFHLVKINEILNYDSQELASEE